MAALDRFHCTNKLKLALVVTFSIYFKNYSIKRILLWLQ